MEISLGVEGKKVVSGICPAHSKAELKELLDYRYPPYFSFSLERGKRYSFLIYHKIDGKYYLDTWLYNFDSNSNKTYTDLKRFDINVPAYYIELWEEIGNFETIPPLDISNFSVEEYRNLKEYFLPINSFILNLSCSGEYGVKSNEEIFPLPEPIGPIRYSLPSTEKATAEVKKPEYYPWNKKQVEIAKSHKFNFPKEGPGARNIHFTESSEICPRCGGIVADYGVRPFRDEEIEPPIIGKPGKNVIGPGNPLIKGDPVIYPGEIPAYKFRPKMK